jgi:hypothetical protein
MWFIILISRNNERNKIQAVLFQDGLGVEGLRLKWGSFFLQVNSEGVNRSDIVTNLFYREVY